MKKYKQLAYKERYQIYALIKENLNYTQIANNIGVHKSTISREIKRNSNNKQLYNPKIANVEVFIRHKNKNKFTKLTRNIQKHIIKLLKTKWSPEQIAGRLKLKKIANITHETIYKFIYTNKANGGRLYLHLCRKMKKYKKYDSKYNTRGRIKNRVSIAQRPKIVDKKTRIGDWEIDTIIGKHHKGAIVTIVERKSKFTLMRILPTKGAGGVANAIIELLYPLKKITCTITSDNGKEFALHEKIAESLNADFYFCDPYSSWQRGLNENTNGLIRRDIPKKSEFANITTDEIVMIQNKLNHRPRKTLGFKTPYEVFMKEVLRKMVA